MIVDSDEVQVGTKLMIYRDHCHVQGRGLLVCQKLTIGEALVIKMLPDGEAEISTTAPVKKHDFLESL